MKMFVKSIFVSYVQYIERWFIWLNYSISMPPGKSCITLRWTAQKRYT